MASDTVMFWVFRPLIMVSCTFYILHVLRLMNHACRKLLDSLCRVRTRKEKLHSFNARMARSCVQYFQYSVHNVVLGWVVHVNLIFFISSQLWGPIRISSWFMHSWYRYSLSSYWNIRALVGIKEKCLAKMERIYNIILTYFRNEYTEIGISSLNNQLGKKKILDQTWVCELMISPDTKSMESQNRAVSVIINNWYNAAANIYELGPRNPQNPPIYMNRFNNNN